MGVLPTFLDTLSRKIEAAEREKDQSPTILKIMSQYFLEVGSNLTVLMGQNLQTVRRNKSNVALTEPRSVLSAKGDSNTVFGTFILNRSI